MNGFEVDPAALREAGKVVGKLSADLPAVQRAIDNGVREGTNQVQAFLVSQALNGYAQQARAALDSVGRALEDHGGGMVNAAGNYENGDREAKWMFQRIKAKFRS